MKWLMAVLLIPIGCLAQGSSTPEPTPAMGQTQGIGYTLATESFMHSVADQMVSNGMKAAGYTFVGPDANEFSSRDGSNNLVWNTTAFPSGCSSLRSYVHSDGLNLELYLTPGYQTCGITPHSGSSDPGNLALGFETQDAATVVACGIDYARLDSCSSLSVQAYFNKLIAALRSAGFSGPTSVSTNDSAGQGSYGPSGWCPTVSGTEVFNPGPDQGVATWNEVASMIDAVNGSTTTGCWTYPWFLGTNAPSLLAANPSRWGSAPGLTDTEVQTQMTLWSAYAAPLFSSMDITTATVGGLSPATENATRISTIINAEVIACDQDALGLQGARVSGGTCAGGNTGVYSKQVSGSSYCVALLNCTGSPTNITVNFSNLQGTPSASYAGRDLWAHSDLGTLTTSYTASSVPSHGVAMLKLSSPAGASNGSGLGAGMTVNKGMAIQ